MSDSRTKWVAGAGIAIGAIVIFVAGGLVGAYIYSQVQPDEAVRQVVVQPSRQFASEGVEVLEVNPGSQAAAAGFEPGDVLLGVNGEAIHRTIEARQALEGLKAGDEVTFAIARDGKQMELDLVLEEDPSQTPLGIRLCCDPAAPSFMRVGNHVQLKPIVRQVIQDSAAEKAGLRSGDTILKVAGVEIEAGEALVEIIASYKPDEVVTLTIQRHGATQSEQLEVRLGEHPEEPGRAFLGVHFTTGFPRLHWVEPGGRELLLRPEADLPKILEDYEALKDHLHFLPQCGSHRLAEDHDVQGVCGLVVAQVAEGTPAAEAGLLRGDLILAVDGAPVSTQEAFADDIRSRKPGDEITLLVFRLEEDTELEIKVNLAEHPDHAGAGYLGLTVPGLYYHLLGDPMEFFEWQSDHMHFEFPSLDFTAAKDQTPMG